MNICQLDRVGAAVGSRSGITGSYLAPSTVVVVERKPGDDAVHASAPAAANAIQMTSAPPSPTPTARSEITRNGGLRSGGGGGGTETEEASKRFITRFNFGLRRVRSAARRHKKSGDQHQPRVGGAHNAQKRERKATKTLAIVLGRLQQSWTWVRCY